MRQQARAEQENLPESRPQDPRVMRNESHCGQQRYRCRSCRTYFGETQGTSMYNLKTPAPEVAQALLIVMQRGRLRAAKEITGHKYKTISV